MTLQMIFYSIYRKINIFFAKNKINVENYCSKVIKIKKYLNFYLHSGDGEGHRLTTAGRRRLLFVLYRLRLHGK